jgi:catechol 2,3-dioxygenase-like lactoylglutathione lyase family enzyme
MATELNHTIVPAHDPKASAQFLANILGLEVGPPTAHFTPVTLANGVTLDFDTYDKVDEHHYAFQVSNEEFEADFSRIQQADIAYYADPACREEGQTYTGKNGNRGTYFRDPNGHLMEILTRAPAEQASDSTKPKIERGIPGGTV